VCYNASESLYIVQLECSIYEMIILYNSTIIFILLLVEEIFFLVGVIQFSTQVLILALILVVKPFKVLFHTGIVKC